MPQNRCLSFACESSYHFRKRHFKLLQSFPIVLSLALLPYFFSSSTVATTHPPLSNNSIIEYVKFHFFIPWLKALFYSGYKELLGKIELIFDDRQGNKTMSYSKVQENFDQGNEN